jgi:hypothetical protein
MSQPLKTSKLNSKISTIPATRFPEPREVDTASNTPIPTTRKNPRSESLTSHPASIGWSLFFSLGSVLIGVNAQIIGGLFATPAFQRDFGYVYQDLYIISAPWQSGIIVCLPLGMFFGASSVGFFMDRYGRKKVCFPFSVLKPCDDNEKLKKANRLSSSQLSSRLLLSSSNFSHAPWRFCCLVRSSLDWWEVCS